MAGVGGSPLGFRVGDRLRVGDRESGQVPRGLGG